MQVPVVTFGPKMLIGAGLDQFRRDAHPVAFAAHGALHDGIHTQFARDLRERFGSMLVLHRRSARNDAQSSDFGQGSNQRFGQAIRKIFLLGSARKIFAAAVLQPSG